MVFVVNIAEIVRFLCLRRVSLATPQGQAVKKPTTYPWAECFLVGKASRVKYTASPPLTLKLTIGGIIHDLKAKILTL